MNLSASYRGRFGAYSESELDFVDHDFRARVEAAPATRHRTSAEFRFLREAEDFGTGQAEFADSLDDQIVDTTVEFAAGYAYGAAEARGNVGAGFSVEDRSFSNLDAITDGDDFTSIGPSVYFSYRVSPDTRLRLETQFRELDFDADSRDRTTLGVFAGLDLAATERTGGTARLGISESDFDQAGIDNRTTFVANVNIYFRPSSINSFTLIVNRNLQTVDNAVDGVGESVDTDLQLAWQYAWTPRFSTRLVLDSDINDRECPNFDTTTIGAAIEFNVGIRRWLSAGVGVGTETRSIDVCEGVEDDGSLDYDRNSIGVHVTATL